MLICMVSTYFLSCDNTEVQKSIIDNLPIEPRVDDCTDCPMTDCCCSVGLLDGDDVELYICGSTTDLTNIECGPVEVGNCEIEGHILITTITSLSPIGYFCMTENSAFYIQNRNTSGNPSTVRITCQAGQVGYQSIDIELSPMETEYVICGEGCRVDECE